MKNPFSRIRSWNTTNCEYDGFAVFVFFSLFTTLTFISNIVLGVDREGWIIWTLWLLTAIYNFCFWQKDKHYYEEKQSLIDRSAEMVENLANELESSDRDCVALRARLVAANRRRKRAEKKLKKNREMYRMELMRIIRSDHKLNDRKS